MKLLKYNNDGRIMVDDEGSLWLLCHEKPEGESGESEVYRHTFSADDIWDKDKGKTIDFFKTPLNMDKHSVLRKKSEISSGETVYFHEATHSFGSDIGAFVRYEFAILNGKVVDWINDDPYNNPRRVPTWRSRVLAALNTSTV